MKLNEKVEAIKYLKNLAIKYRNYEFAAWLRDREKEILHQLNLPTNVSYNYEEQITYSQYLHLTDLISEFEKKNNYDYSEMKDILYKNCINVIREGKLDQLFGKS